jgi:pyridoxal phosphate enzyme (YggS family)
VSAIGGADPRSAELAAALTAQRERVAAACRAVDRDPAGVTLIAVTKTYPAADVLRLAALGVTDIGENRDQEAAPKAAEVSAAGAAVRWHFIGQLQRNKCRSVARYADVVQSVDSVRLATALAESADRAHRTLDVLVQISLDGDATRGGAVDGGPDPDVDLRAVAERVAAATGSLRLRGVMAVAPMASEPGAAFNRLATIADWIRGEYPTATMVSAGMSGDLEAAVAAGATHVRIGTAILGNRLPPAVT